MPNPVNPINIGTEEFPATVNDMYNMIEPIIVQELHGARLKNTLIDVDGFFFYDCKENSENPTGQVIESSLIKAAEAIAFDKNDFSLAPHDVNIHTKYFKEWKDIQFPTTVRRDDARRVVARKGVGVEDVVFEIVNTLALGDMDFDYQQRRALLMQSPVPDYGAILGGVPKTMKGVLAAARDMYNHLIANNSDLTGVKWRTATPAADVRIAISTKLLNYIDVIELAQAFNLTKEEMFGIIVPVNMDDLPEAEWYKLVVYDRHAMNVSEFIYDYTQDIVGRGRYTNHYLTTSRQYFYNDIFKACAIDCSQAAEAAKGEIFGTHTTYTVTPTLNSVATLEPAPAATIGEGMTLYTVVTPVEGQEITGLTVTVNMTSDISTTAVSVDEDKNVAYILIPAVTANVTITVAEA